MESLEQFSSVVREDTNHGEGMQEVAADANRIITGGAPTILIGNKE